jgi:RHS repeat-associated protein
MAGISDKVIKTNYSENKCRYNAGTELQNKEFSDGTGLVYYDAGFRRLDPQLGRFDQIDPLSDRTNFFSAYQYAGNNPILMNDPTELKGVAPTQTYHVYNTIGGPSIDQINQISGINNNMGADAGPSG